MVENRVQRLLAKAEECEIKARMAADRSVVAMFHDLAQQWRDLAEQLERLESRGKNPE